MTTFEDTKVGDRVWCLWHEQWSTIVKITPGLEYPITTELDTYTVDGRQCKSRARVLFWDEVVIIAPPMPIVQLDIDTKVLVWDGGNDKEKRHFSHFGETGRIHVFPQGMTSWTCKKTVSYSCWKLAEETK